jgi:hypothetical protein
LRRKSPRLAALCGVTSRQMPHNRPWRFAAVALLAALGACDRVWVYRIPDRPRIGTEARPEYVLSAGLNVSYSVGFMWFAGRLCAHGEVHNGTQNAIVFHPDRFFFEDGSGRRYLPRKPSGGKWREHPVDIAPGRSFEIEQWSEDGPATDGSFGAQRLRPEGRLMLFEQHGIVVDGQVAPVKVRLEVHDPA